MKFEACYNSRGKVGSAQKLNLRLTYIKHLCHNYKYLHLHHINKSNGENPLHIIESCFKIIQAII